MSDTVAEQEQAALFDLSGKEFNLMFVDAHQPLQVFNNPLHWKAHKLQVLIARLDKQAERNPAQFNSANYITAMNELEKCMEKINAVYDQGGLAEDGDAETAPEVGEGTTPSVDSRVSADNPLTR